jgi:hypothetical protein
MSANAVKAYINGIYIGEVTSTYSSGTMILTIGRRSSGSYLFNGKIDNIKVYNTILTSVQQLQNYNAVKSRFGH